MTDEVDALVGDGNKYRTTIEAYVHSPWGEEQWQLHKHGEVPLERTQRDLSPLQRRFITLASDVYEPDPDDMQSSGISTPSGHGSTPSVSHRQTEKLI